MNNQTKILYATAVAIATALPLAFALSWIELKWGHSIYGFTFWFVIPVGAVACGIVASSGSYFASKALHLQPSTTTRALAVVTAVATFFITHFLTFQAIPMPSAIQASDFMHFGTYLKLVMTEATYGKAGSDGFRLGNLGYGLAVLEIGGFAAGGIFLQRTLNTRPWCSDCARYLKKGKTIKSSYTDSADYATARNNALELSKTTHASEIMSALEMAQVKVKSRRVKHQLWGTSYQCEDCLREHAIIFGQSLQGKKWEADTKTATHPPTIAESLRKTPA